MKRVILVLAFVLMGIVSQGKETWFTAQGFAMKTQYEQQYSAWESCNVPVMMDLERKKIVIHSKEIQMIDYVSLEQRELNGYKYVTGLASDTNYQTIRIEIWFMGNTIVLRIKYSDVEYQYALKE